MPTSKKVTPQSHAGKTHPQNASAMNNMAKSDVIFRNENPQRKIIPGASIEKKGQRDKE